MNAVVDTGERLPNLTEADIADVWRARVQNEADEKFSRDHRRHAEAEVLRRAADAEAAVLGTPWGDITITLPNTYSYNSSIVDRELYVLVERDGLIDQWNQFVQHSYKINKTWLNKLVKRGKEYADVIERMTNAATGSPKIEGPTLADIEDVDARRDAIL